MPKASPAFSKPSPPASCHLCELATSLPIYSLSAKISQSWFLKLAIKEPALANQGGKETKYCKAKVNDLFLG